MAIHDANFADMPKKTSILPPEIEALYPGITLSQYRLLCFIAYHSGYSPWTVTVYDGMFRVAKNRTEKDYTGIQKAGWLDNDNAVPAEMYFDTVLPMMREFPDWVNGFDNFKYYRTDTDVYLWKVARCISAGDIGYAAGIPYPATGDGWKRFVPLVLRQDGEKVMSLLPECDRRKVVERILEKALDDDNLSIGMLDKIDTVIGAMFSEKPKKQLLDESAAYRFFLTGNAPSPDGNDSSMWSSALSAIDLLQKGDLSASYESFRQALQLVEPDESRNLFTNQLLTWFYALCLVRCRRNLRSGRAEDAFKAMMGDTKMKYSYKHAATRVLLLHLDDSSKTLAKDVETEIKAAAARHRSVLDTYLFNMVLKQYQVDDEVISKMNMGVETLPKALVVRNEISASARMTSAEREELKMAFNGGSVIGTIPRKASWEMALSELTGQMRQHFEESENVEKRIIYFVNGKWITAIMEQSRKAGSEDENDWGHDRLLSRKTFIGAGYDSMDILDMKVAKAIANKVIDRPDTDAILPLLAGTGRIFTGEHYHAPYTPLKVEAERPMVAFSGRDGKIVVSSNVPLPQDGNIPSSVTYPKGDGYVCVTVNPMQKDILRNLLEVKEFPAGAVHRIRDIIDSLEGIIDVRSDLAGISVIPTAQGGGRLALRIAPAKQDDCYDLDVESAPYEAGFIRCEPGQGAEDAYDDSTGSPVIVRRDLQLEYDNYMEFREYAENDIGLEFLSSTKAQIWASESLLKVLTWAFDNRDKCFVEWPEGRALRFRGEVKASDIDITVNSGIDWFKVEGEVSIGDEKFKLDEILKAMRESDVNGFIRLGDKDYIRMSDTIRRHLDAIDDMMSGRKGGERVAPVYRVGQLAWILGEDGGLHGTMDAGFKNLLDRMQAAYDSTPEVPEELRADLRDYQKEGYRWMKRLDAWGAGACLADDMGLGKTVQSLALLLSKANEGPSLVIAPKSVIPNWDIETAKFAPTLNVKVLNNESDRKECIAAAGPDDLILATYGVLCTEAEALASRGWNVVCLDEAHQIKNRNTRVSAAAMNLQAGSRIILTGTPIQNHLGELWNLFQFINPGLLGQWSDFKSKYMQTGLDDEHKEFLKDLVQPFILRRTKEEVLSELPEKMVYEQMVELSKEETVLYEAMRRNAEDNIKSAGKKKKDQGKDDDNKIQINFFAELTNLRMAACSMSLVHDDWKKGSSKTDALKGILDELSGNEGNRVLVFSQFTSYLAQIRAMLDKAGMRYLYLDGQTDLDERSELVTQFQNGDCPIFLASLKAGGLGLNLTAANYVILLDPWWNPAIENQAMDRAHRIGQKRNVTVIRLIAQHTIEEKILRLHETKQSLSDDILVGTSESWHLTMDDVLDMVSPFR